MNKISLIVLVCLLSFQSYAQTKLIVSESDYKNESLLFYSYSDYISQVKDTVAFVTTIEDGSFSVALDLQETKQIFLDVGVYHCWFYADKDKAEHQLVLPEKRSKTKVEELNIYFEAVNFRLGIRNNNSKGLNQLIATYDKIYASFLEENFDTIYKFPHNTLVDKFEKSMDNYFSEIKHFFFKDYVKYSIAELRYIGPNRSFEPITMRYFKDQSIAYNNPNYMNLFNLLYKDFFNYYTHTKEGKKLYNSIEHGRSVKKLNKVLKQNLSLQDEQLNELIILKSLHDEFSNSRLPNHVSFPGPQMKIILDSIHGFSNNTEHRKIAGNIIKKVSHNNKSNLNKAVPDFSLLDINDSLVSFKNLQGKYIYLSFMRTDIVPAMESMDRMRSFHKNHKNDIEIVSVFTDEDKDVFSRIDTSKYQWTILHIGDRRDLLEYYNVISWPQFHLISPSGQLMVSPAPSIKEKFEPRFFEIYTRTHY